MSSESDADSSSCFGYCASCAEVHALPQGRAEAHARALMQEFEEIRRLDYLSSSRQADPRLAFDHLFPGQRGHMFGVLECLDSAGRSIVLRAFSSLHEGIRYIEGWVPPILSRRTYSEVVLPGQAKIKKMSRAMQRLEPSSSRHVALASERKRISNELMDKLRVLYRFSNFKGEERSLREAFLFPDAIPGGVGECCAPKLLNHAARSGLRPVGMAEFYWGAPTPSGGREAGKFYPCCETRCRPLLGFMLCGVKNAD